MSRGTSALLASLAALALWGCVERKMLIRSEPPGAPVYVDEQYVGETPLDHPFAHYGVRRIRVGPLRDAADRLSYREQEQVAEFRAPWYETFPIDFVFEVLYPLRIVDEHPVPTFVLEPAAPDEVPADVRVEQIRQRAERFRDRALRAVPEAQ